MDQESGFRKAFWRILPFLMLCYTISYLDRVNIGFAKLQMNGMLGIDERAYGLGAGVFFIGYFFFQIPANLILERIGARRWIACIMITWGLVSCLFVFTRGVHSFLVLRFVLGATEAGFYPGVLYYLTQWFPGYRRGAIVAMFMSSIPIAGLIGNPISGWIMNSTDSLYGLAGWQWLFLLEGMPALLVGLLVPLVLLDRIVDAGWLTSTEKQLMQAEVEGTVKGAEESLTEALRQSRTWFLAGIYFCIIMGQYGVTFWTPTLMMGAGARGSFFIGMLSAIPFACAVLAMNLIGRSADRKRERRWHLILPTLAAAIGFAILPQLHGLSLSVAALSLAAAGVLTSTPLFWSLPTAYLRGKAAAGSIALINAVGNLAGFVSPFMIGWLSNVTHSSSVGLYALASVLLVGAVAVIPIPATRLN
jgi:MFS family permease